MSTVRFPADTAFARVLLGAFLVLCVAWAAIACKWAMGSALASRSDELEVVEAGVALAPGDALGRYAYAGLLEKTFNMEQIARSLSEYQVAASLVPWDYRLWIGLGRARERDGDRAGAERAYRRAGELAPHYTRIKWALGNLLVRDGRTEEGFADIRSAANSDENYAAPAVAAAWQVFEGDLTRITAALGDGDSSRAELAKRLADQKRFDEAAAIWSSIPEGRRGALVEQAKHIAQKAIDDGKFRVALSVSNEYAEPPARFDTVTNGGFELPIKPRSAGPFDWKNIEGIYPQMGPTDGQKASGGASLIVRFGDPANLELRPLSQTIAVEPNGRYSLSLSHRSEIKSQAVFRWEVIAGANGARLASTEPLVVTNDWVTSTVEFNVPVDVDGITLRLVRENCSAPICTVAGSIWFDDFVLKRL